MLLKRLKLPPHLSPLIPRLESARVQTTEQLLVTRPHVLATLLSSTGADASTDAAALDELLAFCLLRAPVVVERGDVLARKHRERARKQDTERAARKNQGHEGAFGIPALDAVGDVGVVAVAGGKGVGKSLLALHATLRLLSADETLTARWVDTEGAFNAARAQAVAAALDLDESILDRLTVSNVFRLEPELLDVLTELRSTPTTRVLVIDNVAALFRDSLMGTTAQGHAAMVVAMDEVAELTSTLGLLTIVTNSPASSIPSNPLSSFSTTTIKPGLGASFAFSTDVEVLLQDTGRVFGLVDEGERDRSSSAPGLRVVAEVLKSRVSPSGTWTMFETDGVKLFDVHPQPLDDAHTTAQSRGTATTGRPAVGFLRETLAPAIQPLRESRRG